LTIAFGRIAIRLYDMKHPVLESRWLWVALTLGAFSVQTGFVHAAGQAGQAATCVVARVPAHISVSSPMAITVDLRDHHIGSPIPANVRFRVEANAPEVELQVACTDLYQAGDPTSAHRIPVAGAGARVTCDHGHTAAGGDSLLPWCSSPRPSLLPAGWSGLVSEAGIFTASPAATFSQNVAVDVAWNTTDPTLPRGEYRGYVKLIGLLRP
jgi:hypothetical protein